MPKLAIIDQCVSAGGVERFIHGLVGGMIGLPVFREWDVTILINRYNTAGLEVRWPEYLTSPNLHVRYIFDDKWGSFVNRLTKPRRIWRIPGTGVLRWEAFLLIARLWIEMECRRENYDVVYSPYPYLMICPDIKMPLVATPHDFNWKHVQLHSASFLGRILHDLVTPGWLHKCHSAVVSSEFIADEIRRFYPKESNKISVVRPGTPSDRCRPGEKDLEEYRNSAGLPSQFLLTAGWILPHKNQKVLVEALGKLKRRGINIPIVFTGPNSNLLGPGARGLNPEYLIEMVQMADRLGLRYGHDYFGLGYVSDFELDCLYSLGSALLAPALYEAGSFPILEAVKARCPVLCSNIPAYAEQNSLLGHNLRVFDPRDPLEVAVAIEELWFNRQEALKRAENAAALLDQVYSWRKAATGYVDIFSSALRKK